MNVYTCMSHLIDGAQVPDGPLGRGGAGEHVVEYMEIALTNLYVYICV